MKIVNIMSSKALGGSEQAFLNYNNALSLGKHEVFAIFNKNGKIKDKLDKLKNVKYLPLIFFKPYILLFPYFYFKIKKIKPDVIIIQTRKILSLFGRIGKILNIPVIFVSHANKTKLLNKADYIFSLAQYQKDFFVKNGFEEDKIFVISNLINERVKFKEFEDFSNTPIFGVMGRFEASKGLDILIEACKILKDKGKKFKVKIGGFAQKQYLDEYYKIIQLIEEYKLKDDIELLGWIDNKKEFYDAIDVFVLPSINESFGIVLLEAMMYSKPIISSLAEGPSEIFEDSKNSFTFPIKDYKKLAELMMKVLDNRELVKKSVKENYDLVNKKYILEEVSKDINDALLICCER
ncbi:MAG TPA: glycosyltransferase family 4 protein [Rickettsiales bacterium]|nr:glycosyltransferase family 4 protein [Rickettsiales bacterium]